MRERRSETPEKTFDHGNVHNVSMESDMDIVFERKEKGRNRKILSTAVTCTTCPWRVTRRWCSRERRSETAEKTDDHGCVHNVSMERHMGMVFE